VLHRGADLRDRARSGGATTNPRPYRDAAGITEQALRFSAPAPNMQVKITVTCAGVQAIETATAAGVNVNATVCFTVPRAPAVTGAVERGLQRREAAGGDVALMSPVCRLMVGRLDDWIQALVRSDSVVADPGVEHWAGLACMKRAYGIVRERGYRSRLVAAAYRHHLHWSKLIGEEFHSYYSAERPSTTA